MKRKFGPKIPTTVRVKRESDRFSRPKAAGIGESYSGTAPILYEDPEELAKVDQQTQNYKKYVRDLVLLYHKQARNMMIMHYGSQLIIIIGAGIVSVLVGVGLPEIPKFIPAILSGVVAIVAAISNQFKFGERYRVRVLTAVNIEQESNWFDRKREPYKGLKPVDALNMFKERIEGFIRAESESRLPPT